MYMYVHVCQYVYDVITILCIYITCTTIIQVLHTQLYKEVQGNIPLIYDNCCVSESESTVSLTIVQYRPFS